jgi:hypothetical protein
MQHSSFNPKARWDRHIPETKEDPGPGILDERIEVLSWFRNGNIQPRAFIWNKKIYKIKQITYRWQERLGQAAISYFSVLTKANLYQISFNNASYSWKIDRIIE